MLATASKPLPRRMKEFDTHICWHAQASYPTFFIISITLSAGKNRIVACLLITDVSVYIFVLIYRGCNSLHSAIYRKCFTACFSPWTRIFLTLMPTTPWFSLSANMSGQQNTCYFHHLSFPYRTLWSICLKLKCLRKLVGLDRRSSSVLSPNPKYSWANISSSIHSWPRPLTPSQKVEWFQLYWEYGRWPVSCLHSGWENKSQ